MCSFNSCAEWNALEKLKTFYFKKVKVALSKDAKKTFEKSKFKTQNLIRTKVKSGLEFCFNSLCTTKRTIFRFKETTQKAPKLNNNYRSPEATTCRKLTFFFVPTHPLFSPSSSRILKGYY